MTNRTLLFQGNETLFFNLQRKSSFRACKFSLPSSYRIHLADLVDISSGEILNQIFSHANYKFRFALQLSQKLYLLNLKCDLWQITVQSALHYYRP